VARPRDAATGIAGGGAATIAAMADGRQGSPRSAGRPADGEVPVGPMTLPEPPLDDGVVALRPWRTEDRDRLVVACRDPEIARWTLMADPFTAADAEQVLLDSVAGWRAGTGATFCITSPQQPSEVGGAIGLFARPATVGQVGPGTAAVGYWVAADRRRRGVASRAVRLVCAWGLHEVGFDRILADVIVGNHASVALLVSLGFTPRGPLSGGLRQRDVQRDADLFEVDSAILGPRAPVDGTAAGLTTT
jgi:RimJ/RimL family protein N-acetyltransferase